MVNDRDALVLRENTGTAGVVETARTVAAVLTEHDIPHLIVGGLAVQEHWSGSPATRLKDKADVTELILRRKLPRNLAINPVVRALYLDTWDALQAER